MDKQSEHYFTRLEIKTYQPSQETEHLSTWTLVLLSLLVFAVLYGLDRLLSLYR